MAVDAFCAKGRILMQVLTFKSDVTDPRQLGRSIGQQWAGEIAQTLYLYLDFFGRVGIDGKRVRTIGENSLDALDAWCPTLAAEVMGIAEGADLPLWQIASLNARTEVLAAVPTGVGECSTAVYAPAGQVPWSLQTWDWHASLAPYGLMREHVSRQGMTIKSFTEFGMLGKIGVNSEGLGLHFNILNHESDHDSGGVPVHAVARRVLEEATSTSEAIGLARSARVGASSVLTVFSNSDTLPRAAGIELSPASTAVVEPGDNDWLLHTNHFLDCSLSAGERTPDKLETYDRLNHLDRVAPSMACRDVRERAAAMCGGAGDQAPICVSSDMTLPLDERWETLLTVSIDVGRCLLDYAEGSPNMLANSGFSRF